MGYVNTVGYSTNLVSRIEPTLRLLNNSQPHSGAGGNGDALLDRQTRWSTNRVADGVGANLAADSHSIESCNSVHCGCGDPVVSICHEVTVTVIDQKIGKLPKDAIRKNLHRHCCVRTWTLGNNVAEAVKNVNGRYRI